MKLYLIKITMKRSKALYYLGNCNNSTIVAFTRKDDALDEMRFRRAQAGGNRTYKLVTIEVPEP